MGKIKQNELDCRDTAPLMLQIRHQLFKRELLEINKFGY